MDLVSSTLDKYLKHRFNGNGLTKRNSDPGPAAATTTTTTITPATTTIQAPSDKSLDEALSPQAAPQQNFANTTNLPAPEVQENILNQDVSNLLNNSSDYSHSFEENIAAPISCPSPPQRQPETSATFTNTLDELHPNKDHPKDVNESDDHVEVIMTNGISEPEDQHTPTIQRITFSKNRPCCLAIKEDLRFLAAGFENSHIHVWNFKDHVSPQKRNASFPLLAHSGPVYGIEFIHNSDLMLSCSEDTTIRLWCLNTKCNLTVYRGHSYPIWSIAVGSQGVFFASASMDATARLWRLDRITPLRIFCGHDEDVECVKFHPNEKYVATGSSDATVRLWSTSDGKMVRLMVGHEQSITSLSFLPDGKFLASASRDGVIKVWNLATNCTSIELSVPSSLTIAFSPEQRFMASCGSDNVLRLWQIDKDELVEKRRLDLDCESTKTILSQFHRNNKLFVIGYQVDSSK